MIKTLLALSALCLIAAPQDPEPTSQPTDERELVERAASGYVRAFYEVKPELLDDCVHKDLKKLGFWRSAPGAEYELHGMTFDQLKSLASRWNANGDKVKADTPNRVEILDMLDTTAAVKVTASWGIDYMQIGKFDGKWQIMHVLWQSHPEDQ